jgi:hypothetical protein
MHHYVLVDTYLGTTTAGKAGAALLREWWKLQYYWSRPWESFPPITTATSKIFVLWAKGDYRAVPEILRPMCQI